MLNRLITIVAALVVTFAATLCHANFAIFQANGFVPAAAPSLTSRSLVGSSPAVLNAQLTWQGASASVASNQALNSCNITAGDPNGNFTPTASGSACVLTISANGVTNLNGTSGSVSQTLTVTGTNGNGTSAGVSVPVTVWADGSTGAQTTGTTLPTLLSTYATRAPWPVASVDYAVGVPTSITLQDPWPGFPSATSADFNSTFLSQCGGFSHVSVLAGHTALLQVAGASSTTISGWDFSLHNGIGLYVNGGSNITIQDNLFQTGTNAENPIQFTSSTTNVTVQYNEINGNGIEANADSGDGSRGALESNSPSMTVQYNYIHDAYPENLRPGSDTASGFTMLVRFNLIRNAGRGASAGAHGDWAQMRAATGDVNDNTSFIFNTMLQDDPPATAQTQGLSWNATAPTGNFGTGTMNNNTAIASGGTAVVNTFFNYDVSQFSSNSVLVEDNYVDRSGIGALGVAHPTNWIGPVPGSGSFSAVTTCSGNVDMVAGSPLTGIFNSFDGISVTCN